MRILTWNCNMAFRRKIQRLLEFDADILVIQECEDKSFDCSPYLKTLWMGDSPHKGIAVFAKPHIVAEVLPYNTDSKWIAPIRFTCAEESFLLFAVWTKDHKKREESYIGQLLHALRDYEPQLKGHKCIIIGDFNSNQIWDKMRENNHSAMTELLSTHNIHSAYHYFYGEAQGEETNPTYFFQKKVDKPFHLDYCYMSREYLSNLREVTVGVYDDWIQWSDHTPIFLHINMENEP